MDWHLPLLITTALFAIFLLFKLRPSLSARGDGAGRSALREARARVTAAKDDVARAEALCDAGDACARTFRGASAVGYYLRAMRSNPTSATLVDRAAAGLAKRPHALESLLWRRLGAEPWEGERRDAAIAALKHLATIYGDSLRQRGRARAIEHVLASLGDGKQHD